ncbi:MAG: fluoride efflux transporter CrcB [Planctomycetes bacterium]|nr:fluoride efflux transporter CrcB [Planctomycetota bacterium]
MMKIFAIGAGGCVGAIGRYAISRYVIYLFPQSDFPYCTLVVNVLGCLLMGILTAVMDVRPLVNAEIRPLLVVGFLGAFTTFSTFGYETLHSLEAENYLGSTANICTNVVLGILAVWSGRSLVQMLMG